MIRFTSIIEKFDQQGEKTGWTYISVTEKMAQKLHPGNKKAFRVKGKIDDHAFQMVSLWPMGGGEFILPVNAAMRKAIRKMKGAAVHVTLEIDNGRIRPPRELLECLADEPKALARFQALNTSMRNYFANWIKSAKTDTTIAKRIAATVEAMEHGWDFGQMLRAMKAKKE